MKNKGRSDYPEYTVTVYKPAVLTEFPSLRKFLIRERNRKASQKKPDKFIPWNYAEMMIGILDQIIQQEKES